MPRKPAQKFNVVLVSDNGSSYLSVRDKTEWTKRTAQKHMDDITATNWFKSNYLSAFLEQV